jgi:hypothetical protein
MELKFFVIRDRRGVLELLNSYKTELNKDALKSRSELVQKIREFADAETRDPHIATYPLTIVESLMKGGKDRREEWLIQQGIGDSQKKGGSVVLCGTSQAKAWNSSSTQT